jgi:hypothetical protein
MRILPLAVGVLFNDFLLLARAEAQGDGAHSLEIKVQ